MRRALQTSLYLFVLVLSINKTSAQYQFDLWNTDNGLPHNTIRAILQTRDGYLWLASLDGLVRFDGVRFTVFTTGNTPALKSNRCTSLFEDQAGQLWIGTEDGGLVKRHDGVFTTFTTDQGLPGNDVRRIWADDQGSIVLLIGQKLFRWKKEKAESYALPTNAPLVSPDENQQTAIVSYRDELGLHIVKSGRTVTLTRASGLSSLEVTAIYQDRQGALWIGTHSGLNHLKNGVVTIFTTKDGLPQNSKVTSISEDRLGNLWLGMGDKGLVRFKDGQFTHYTTANGLSDDNVLSIYEDREGTIWIGTYTNGLNRLSRDVVHMYSEQNGLPSNNVYPILEDRSGNVWLGTWEKGLARFTNGRFAHYSKEDGLPGNILTALAEGRDGALWIGAYNGVARYKDGQYTQFREKLGSDFYYVSAILEDRDGAIWLGADTKLFRLKDEAVSAFTTNDGLAGNDVKAILQDRKGVLWFGSYGGLTRYEDGRWRAFTKRDGLASEKIRSLYEDSDGVIWIGTYDGGLGRLKDNKITSITQKDGLYNNGVFQILEDGRGNFWLSCNLGIYRVSKQQLNDFADGKVRFVTSVPYGRHDGLSNIECNGGTQPAGVKTHDGHLWFPTQGGAAVIDSNEITLNPLPPPVQIAGCLLHRAVVDCRQDVKLAPGQQSLEISYTGLSFIKPEQIRFKYKLTGLDQDWVDVGTRRTAYYSHLPPGTYTFTVIAANSDGVWNTEGQTLHITVVPPFWRTWWFLSVVGLSLVGLALLGYRRHVTKLQREKAAQVRFSRQLIQSQEYERKRIAGELHDGLGQNLLVIKNLALFGLASQNSQDVAQAQLGEISTTVSEAIEEVRTIARNLRPYELDRLGLTLAVESIMTRIAGSSTIKFASQIDPIDDSFSHEAEINLYRIVQEAVNNVVKHSEASEVSITIKKDGSQVVFTIHDNGKGFAPDTERGAVATWSRGATQYESGSDLMRLRNRGFGLTGIIERVAMLNGKLSMQSSPGQGTTIRVSIEVERKEEGEKRGRGEGE